MLAAGARVAEDLAPDVAPVGYVADAAAIAQTIFDLIESARSSIVLQMYMFAGNGETEMLLEQPDAFPYAHAVAGWLVDKKQRSPELDIVVVLDTQTIDDPRYTRRKEGPFARDVLAEAGITVLHANLFGTTFDRARRFPRSARLHDGRYRDVDAGVYGRAQQRWQTWHNVEDHRKNLVIDEGAWAAVTSHNFLDVASTWHENMFVVGAPVAGALWQHASASIRAALELPQRASYEQRLRARALAARPPATAPVPLPHFPFAELAVLGDPPAIAAPVEHAIEVLDTLEIRPRLVRALSEVAPGDQVRAASAWFSDVPLLDAFVAASERGADVQILVDDLAALPVGRLPSWFIRAHANTRVTERARMIVRPGFELRVHPSGAGRMMHLKTAAFLGKRRYLIGGQANYTPNSFNGAWLETAVVIEGDAVVDAFLAQFGALWTASAVPRALPAPSRWLRRALLWLVERTVFTF